MGRIIIHNQGIYNGLTKDLSNEKVEYINNALHYKPAILHEEYTDSEIKAISKFLNDWFKDTYIYGSDAMEVVGSVKGEEKMTKYLIDYYPLGWLRCENVSFCEKYGTQDPYMEGLLWQYDMATHKWPSKNGIIFAYNNSWWAEIEADNPKEALDKFFEELDKETKK